MTVRVHLGFLSVCGMMATALGIGCAPCAHAEVHEFLALTLSAQRGAQAQHQSFTSNTTTPSNATILNSKMMGPTTDEHYDVNETVASGPSSSALVSNDETDGTLPDAPQPQEQTPSAPPPPVSEPRINQLSVLPPKLTTYRLDAGDKLYIYVHDAYGPPAVILPAFGAALGMVNPKPAYPKEWKDGAGAFGRRYGDSLAKNTSKSTAEFMTDAVLHEDPRYSRSKSTGAFGRTFHAIAFTFFDKTDSGKTTLAVSHFAGAAADGFVGMAYLPAGFNDLTHAGQRSVISLGAATFGNILNEFEPEWGPIYQKLHIPQILPTWWVRERQ